MNEFFSLLCYDVDGIAEKVAPVLFRHGRSISLHGVRGIGKTTLAQSVLVIGTVESLGLAPSVAASLVLHFGGVCVARALYVQPAQGASTGMRPPQSEKCAKASRGKLVVPWTSWRNPSLLNSNAIFALLSS